MSGDLKVNRIKSANAGSLALLGDAVKLAQEAIPKLATTAQNRQERKEILDTVSTLGEYCHVNGFDPTRTFQHVANFDTEVWTLVLAMFAKEDDDGNLMDDGLLYKWNNERGCLVLNKDFFFAILSYFESLGVNCDMRGKIIV